MSPLKQNGSDTYRRILETSGEVFVEHGFHNATVREISSRAGVNLAAINYHFRDKEGLYLEVLKFWARSAMEKYPPNAGVQKSDPPQMRLKAFVQSVVLRMLDEGQPSWFWKLVAKEFNEPTKALDMLVENFVRPSFVILSSIVRELLGRDASEEEVRMSCISVVGQCFHFYNARHVIARLFHKSGYSPGEKEKIVRHVFQFSLNAMQKKAGNEKGKQK